MADDSVSDTELEVVFHQAAEWMRNKKNLKLSTDQKLSLYGLFKQVAKGLLLCELVQNEMYVFRLMLGPHFSSLSCCFCMHRLARALVVPQSQEYLT